MTPAPTPDDLRAQRAARLALLAEPVDLLIAAIAVKVDDADLSEIARTLSILLSAIDDLTKQLETQDDHDPDGRVAGARERLAHLVDRVAAAAPAPTADPRAD